MESALVGGQRAVAVWPMQCTSSGLRSFNDECPSIGVNEVGEEEFGSMSMECRGVAKP